MAISLVQSAVVGTRAEQCPIFYRCLGGNGELHRNADTSESAQDQIRGQPSYCRRITMLRMPYSFQYSHLLPTLF
jgi:hypothetical protein